MCETNMASSADSFWKAVERWAKNQPEIVLEFSASPLGWLETFRGRVKTVDRPWVTFLDLETKEERPFDFGNADIRFHSFERIDSAGAFAVRWEGGAESVECVLTELRELGEPN
jgi:hypothetical protein